MATDLDKNTTQYWDNYYASKDASRVPIPSQFAPFALQEAGKPDVVLEFGCGMGRDSIFFARQGVKTIGLDGLCCTKHSSFRLPPSAKDSCFYSDAIFF